MNIFLLDKDMQLNVQYHCDKHVIKMILEAAQIASTVHWLTNSEGPYKPTHKNHPLVVWACESMLAYRYVVRYGLALCKEYTHRYGKIHKTESKLLWLKENEPSIPVKPTKFTIVVAPDCLVKDDRVLSYRRYYIRHKLHMLSWKNRPVPTWISDPLYK